MRRRPADLLLGVQALMPSSAREFISNTQDLRIVFDADANGAAAGFTWHEGDRQRRAARIEASNASAGN
jgi:hypothetical protein